MPDPLPTPFGAAIRKARRGGASVRSLAKAAGISEGRWRQIENGYSSAGGGVQVPARPRPDTVVAMARAVGLDEVRALRLAGFEAEDLPDDAAEGDVERLVVEGVSDAVLLAELARRLGDRDRQAWPPESVVPLRGGRTKGAMDGAPTAADDVAGQIAARRSSDEKERSRRDQS